MDTDGRVHPIQQNQFKIYPDYLNSAIIQVHSNENNSTLIYFNYFYVYVNNAFIIIILISAKLLADLFVVEQIP